LRWNLDQNTKYIDRVYETLRQFLPQTLSDTLLYFYCVCATYLLIHSTNDNAVTWLVVSNYTIFPA